MDKDTARSLGRLYRMGSDVLKGFDTPTELNLYFSRPARAVGNTMQRLVRGDRAGGSFQGKWDFDTLDPHIAPIMDQMDADELDRLDDAMQIEFWSGYHGGWGSMSVKAAAERLGCGQANVRKLIDSGAIKADKAGGRWRVWSKSVDEYARRKDNDGLGSGD